MGQNSRMQALWRRTHPYSAMLLDYQEALASVKARLAELRALAREQNRPGSPIPPAEQYRLEKRILTLVDEQYELCRDMKDIREYAEREISWENETAAAQAI